MTKKIFKTKIKRKREDIKKIKIEKEGHTFVSEMSRQKKIILPLRKREKRKIFKLGFWARNKLARNPDKTYIIFMKFSNGTAKNFIIKTSSQTFKMKDKTYFLDYEEAWYNISLNQYSLDYHENFAVPINREVIQQGDEAFYCVTPENLKPLIKAEYVKALVGANKLNKLLIWLLIVSFVGAISGVIMVLSLLGKATGTT